MSDITTTVAVAAAAAAIARPLATVTCRTLEKLIEDPVKELSGLLGDRVRALRADNARRVTALAKERLEARQMLDAEVPLGFLGDALQRAASAEDPTLQELFAELIANGVATEDARHPAYLDVLSRLSARDARTFLDEVKSTQPFAYGGLTRNSDPQRLASQTRLSALNLIERTGGQAAEGLGGLVAMLPMGMQAFPIFKLTPFGFQFAAAIGLVNADGSPRVAREEA
jgi:hypothetical protein